MNPKPDQSPALAQDLRTLASRLKRRLREQAQSGDLPPSQVAALLRLEQDGPATNSALARAEGMRPQSMTPVVAALEAANLVTLIPDPSDGRQTLIALTDFCRTLITEGRAARQDWLTQMIRTRLTPAEQAQIATALTLLRRLLAD